MPHYSETQPSLHSELQLPCGVVLKNRLAKSPMSDSLANGKGDPTQGQIRLYERWAQGGVALSLIGEVQGDPRFPEKPGNLVLDTKSDQALLRSLTQRAVIGGAHLWPQIGHAGALSHLPISEPKGPSALQLDGLQCNELTPADIKELPAMYARTALSAQNAGFTGVQIHAGHGFLLSQFLSPLFNHRKDSYGGSIEKRAAIILEIIDEVRSAVGLSFPVGIRINSTDKLEGGLTEEGALKVIGLLDKTSVDLIDISGGTYFPGAKASSDTASEGAYFLEFAKRAKSATTIPLVVTGGFKRQHQAVDALQNGSVDMVGLARAMVLDTNLANSWLSEKSCDPKFPEFQSTLPGGVTAWYTMRLTALGLDQEHAFDLDRGLDLPAALQEYEQRDAQRCLKWQKKFACVNN